MTATTALRILTQPLSINECHIETDEWCRYICVWCGYHWGGSFRYRQDAELCRSWCLDQPDCDVVEWVLQNEG